MGIFNWTNPHRVTKREFKQVKTSLASKGVSRRSIKHVEEVSSAALNAPGKGSGISKTEKKQIVQTLKSPKSTHRMSEQSVKKVDRALEKKL